MGFFDELVKAKGMFEMVAVLYEYRYPILIIVGIIATIIFVRSYIHGREIKKLKNGMVGNSVGQGPSIGHIENAYFLNATPQDVKLLMNSQQQPRQLLQAPEAKIICPRCHRREYSPGAGKCLFCDMDYLACTCGKRNFVFHRFCRLCGKPLQSTNTNEQIATIPCSHCDYAVKANWNYCGYCGKDKHSQVDHKPAPKPRPKKKPGSNKVR